MRQTILLVMTVALILTGLSWFKSDWVGGGGMFFPSDGPDFWSHGMPWWYMSCYLDGTCSFYLRYFLYDYLFWLVVTFLGTLLIWGTWRLIKGVFLRSKN